MAMLHFDPVSFLIGKVLSAVLSSAWNYGKQLVQAVALYYFVVLFVLAYCSAYASSLPRPGAGRVAAA